MFFGLKGFIILRPPLFLLNFRLMTTSCFYAGHFGQIEEFIHERMEHSNLVSLLFRSVDISGVHSVIGVQV